MVLTTNPYFVGTLFLIHFCLQAIILVCLNVFIETFTNHAQAGMVRGIFLTLLNLGILIAPFFGGALLSLGYSFTLLYTVAALTLLPFIYFLHRFMRHAPDPAYHSVDVLKAIQYAWDNKNLRGAFVAVFLLECFYAFMVIYFPIYIVGIGIPLLTYLTAIVPISLIPLVVLPYELGIIADKKLGEKEFLILGLLVTAMSLLIMAILSTTVTIVWILVLVLSRIGAASIETMVYTYFYKKIGPEDVSLTAAFTNMRSTATIAMTAVSIIIAPLITTYPQLMFLILALALLYGITYILPIKDTR
jgi:MFS family permease